MLQHTLRIHTTTHTNEPDSLFNNVNIRDCRYFGCIAETRGEDDITGNRSSPSPPPPPLRPFPSPRLPPPLLWELGQARRYLVAAKQLKTEKIIIGHQSRSLRRMHEDEKRNRGENFFSFSRAANSILENYIGNFEIFCKWKSTYKGEGGEKREKDITIDTRNVDTGVKNTHTEREHLKLTESWNVTGIAILPVQTSRHRSKFHCV